MDKADKILILGGSGMVGSAVRRELLRQSFCNQLLPTRSELDLTRQQATLDYFDQHRPDYVFLAAAKVGGLFDNNSKRADYMMENLSIQNHVFQAAKLYSPKKLIFMASSCIYPKLCEQPMNESQLFTGSLEETNSPFAMAKLSGLMLAELSQLPWHGIISCSLYGEEDNFNPTTGHVLPGLTVRMLEAKKNNDDTFVIWGSGKPRREFLHVDDMARAVVLSLVTNHPLPPYFNVGAGIDISIEELAKVIAGHLNYTGNFAFDKSKEDGVYQKLLRTQTLEQQGWKPQIPIHDGVARIVNSLKSGER